jgi:hypothetical protein
LCATEKGYLQPCLDALVPAQLLGFLAVVGRYFSI